MLDKNLKMIRKDKSITQKKLANLAGVSQSTICYIENGKFPRTDTIQKICKALGVKLEDLINEEEDI